MSKDSLAGDPDRGHGGYDWERASELMAAAMREHQKGKRSVFAKLQPYWVYYDKHWDAWLGWYEETLPESLRGKALRVREWK